MMPAAPSEPTGQGMAKVAPLQADNLNRRMTLLLSEVTNNRCLKEYQEAVKFDGKQATAESFTAIMERTMDALANGPEVGQYFVQDGHIPAPAEDSANRMTQGCGVQCGTTSVSARSCPVAQQYRRQKWNSLVGQGGKPA